MTAAAPGTDPLAQALAWVEAGRPVVLATVATAWNAASHRPGELMAVTDDGVFDGSVSGGCAEAAVVEAAAAVLAGAPPRLMELGVVSDPAAHAVGLACGGPLRVWIEPAPAAETLRRLVDERPIAAVTDLGTGAWTVVRPDDGDPMVRTALDNGRGGLDGRRLIRVFVPPWRLVLIGAGPIARTLAPMAAAAGFAVTVIDPRPPFATAARFPALALRHEEPGTAIAAIAPDTRTAVVTLAHRPELDDPALEAALATRAYYVAALGSRRTQAARLERLAGRGLDAAALARIHGPAGLDLGGRRPEEIAVSILAQAVAARYRPGAHP